MSEYPDQHLIDELVRTLGSEEKNGHHKHAESVLSDEQVIELCRKAKNARKFASLFDDGDISAYPSDSEADLALLGLLAFYTQERHQLEQIFSRSALANRGKWGRADYRIRTIDRALDNVTETYRGRENLSSSAHSLYGNDDDTSDDVPGLVCFAKKSAPEPVEFLLGRAIPKGYVTNLHGAGGFGKSIIAMMVALGVSGYQKKSMGLPILKHGEVLYLDSELDERGQHPRVHEICKGLDILVPEGLHYLSALGLDTATAFKRALKAAKKLEIALLVIDSWGPFMDGDMESARDVIRFYNNYLKPFVDLGVTVLIVDHQSRTQEGQNYQKKGAFGSVYKENLARSVFQIERVNEDRDDGTLRIRARHRKSNFGPRLEPFEVEIKFEPGKIAAKRVAITEASKAAEETLGGRDRVLAALVKGPASAKEVVEDTGLSLGTVRNLLSELVPGEVTATEQDGRTKIYALAEVKPEPKKEPGKDENLSSSFSYREKDDDDTSAEKETPLSSDLKPGESDTLEEICERREGRRSGFDVNKRTALDEDLTGWAPEELDLRRRLLSGETVRFDMHKNGPHGRFKEWAQGQGLLFYVGRRNPRQGLEDSDWRNTFEECKDGTREEVVRLFREKRIPELLTAGKNPEEYRGKALGCWCKLDEACHGDVLIGALYDHHSHPTYKDCDDGRISYVTNPDQLDEAISKLDQATLVGLDLETVGTDPATGTLRLVQASDGEKTFVVDAASVDPKPLLESVVGKEIIAHNALFELSWLKHLYDLEPQDVHDTMIMSQVIHAGKIPPHDHGLADVAKRELALALDKSQQTSDWGRSELSQEQIDYAAMDAEILPKLYHKLKGALEDA